MGRMIVAAGMVALMLAGAGRASPAPAELPIWLAGCWIEQKTEERWVEECWTAARGGTMMGSGRTGKGDRVAFWEVIQIVRDDDGMSFFAAPKGERRTQFRMKADGGPGVSFYNAGHDYPQRIRYWRDGDALLAEVALADGTKPQRWQFKRQ